MMAPSNNNQQKQWKNQPELVHPHQNLRNGKVDNQFLWLDF